MNFGLVMKSRDIAGERQSWRWRMRDFFLRDHAARLSTE
jgi:hypothetical protein